MSKKPSKLLKEKTKKINIEMKSQRENWGTQGIGKDVVLRSQSSLKPRPTKSRHWSAKPVQRVTQQGRVGLKGLPRRKEWKTVSTACRGIPDAKKKNAGHFSVGEVVLWPTLNRCVRGRRWKKKTERNWVQKRYQRRGGGAKHQKNSPNKGSRNKRGAKLRKAEKKRWLIIQRADKDRLQDVPIPSQREQGDSWKGRKTRGFLRSK